jgi:hypothetical protein
MNVSLGALYFSRPDFTLQTVAEVSLSAKSKRTLTYGFWILTNLTRRTAEVVPWRMVTVETAGSWTGRALPPLFSCLRFPSDTLGAFVVAQPEKGRVTQGEWAGSDVGQVHERAAFAWSGSSRSTTSARKCGVNPLRPLDGLRAIAVPLHFIGPVRAVGRLFATDAIFGGTARGGTRRL